MPLNSPAFFPPWRPQRGFRDTPAQVVPLAPAAIQIPLCWLKQPVRLRLDRPYATATVSQPNFGTAYDSAPNAISNFPFTATINSATGGDAQNLATWTVTYRSTALMRSPVLVIPLMIRSDSEKVMLLRIERNQRIKITGTPPEYPLGAADLIVSGISNTIGVQQREITFTTRPVIGTSPGVSGPWFRLGYSAYGGPDVILF